MESFANMMQAKMDAQYTKITSSVDQKFDKSDSTKESKKIGAATQPIKAEPATQTQYDRIFFKN